MKQTLKTIILVILHTARVAALVLAIIAFVCAFGEGADFTALQQFAHSAGSIAGFALFTAVYMWADKGLEVINSKRVK